MSEQYVIVEGNPIDGFTFTGPFHDIEAAQMWGEYSTENEWWYTTLSSPYDDENNNHESGYYWSDEAKAILQRGDE